MFSPNAGSDDDPALKRRWWMYHFRTLALLDSIQFRRFQESYKSKFIYQYIYTELSDGAYFSLISLSLLSTGLHAISQTLFFGVVRNIS